MAMKKHLGGFLFLLFVFKYFVIQKVIKINGITEGRNLTSAFMFYLFYVFKRFYLFIHERHTEREREAETQAEGEAGSMQGA